MLKQFISLLRFFDFGISIFIFIALVFPHIIYDINPKLIMEMGVDVFVTFEVICLVSWLIQSTIIHIFNDSRAFFKQVNFLKSKTLHLVLIAGLFLINIIVIAIIHLTFANTGTENVFTSNLLYIYSATTLVRIISNFSISLSRMEFESAKTLARLLIFIIAAIGLGVFDFYTFGVHPSESQLTVFSLENYKTKDPLIFLNILFWYYFLVAVFLRRNPKEMTIVDQK